MLNIEFRMLNENHLPPSPHPAATTPSLRSQLRHSWLRWALPGFVGLRIPNPASQHDFQRLSTFNDFQRGPKGRFQRGAKHRFNEDVFLKNILAF